MRAWTRAVELAGIEARIDVGEIVHAPPRRERRFHARRRGADQMRGAAGRSRRWRGRARRRFVPVKPASARITGSCATGEHMVEAEPQAPLNAPVAHHRPGIVGQLHLHRLAQERGEPRGEDQARPAWPHFGDMMSGAAAIRVPRERDERRRRDSCPQRRRSRRAEHSSEATRACGRLGAVAGEERAAAAWLWSTLATAAGLLQADRSAADV